MTSAWREMSLQHASAGVRRTRHYEHHNDATGNTTAQVLLALECLHSNSIAYRDLKPENTLIALDGHVLLADFGVSKILGRRIADSEPSDTTSQTAERHPRPSRSMLTLVGTREYMAPEYFRGGGYTPAVDFWALAVMLYEMLTGDVPRQPGGEALWSTTVEPILNCDSLSAGAADLLRSMLTVDLSARLGAGRAGVTDIKAHGFFTDCDWKVRRARAEIAPRSRRDRPEISPRFYVSTGDTSEGAARAPLSRTPVITRASVAIAHPEGHRSKRREGGMTGHRDGSRRCISHDMNPDLEMNLADASRMI